MTPFLFFLVTFGSCFGLFDFLQDKHKIHTFSLKNNLFALLRKKDENFIFYDNIYVLYIYTDSSLLDFF